MNNDDLKRQVLLLALHAGRRALTLFMISVLVGLAILGLWLVQAIHIVASLTAISVLLAYVISPSVNYLHGRRRVPRVLAISLVYLAVAVVLGVSLAYVIPVVHEQFLALTRNLTLYLANLQVTIDRAFQWIVAHSPKMAQPMLHQIDPDSLKLDRLAGELQNLIPTIAGSTFVGVFSGVKFAAGLLAGMVLVPLFTFYILMDVERYSQGFLRLVPRRWKADVADLMREIDAVLGRYIRGQLLVCFTVGASIALVLNLMGLQYAILIGVFAGIVDIIPYVGVAIGMVPAFIIAMVHHGIVWAIVVILVMEAIHWTEGHIIVPAVIGHSVGLPPLVVMVALGAGAELGGIMGMVLAIPAAAIIRVLGNFYVRRLEHWEAQVEGSAPSDEGTPVRQDNPTAATNGPSPELSGGQTSGADEAVLTESAGHL